MRSKIEDSLSNSGGLDEVKFEVINSIVTIYNKFDIKDLKYVGRLSHLLTRADTSYNIECNEKDQNKNIKEFFVNLLKPGGNKNKIRLIEVMETKNDKELFKKLKELYN